jgi:sec-independent protein translocase protein TatA
MFGLGFPEIIIILVIIFIVFGAGKLSGLGEAIGKSIINFRKTYKEPDTIDITPPKDGKINEKSSQ